ncbi:MAG: hypothetical protein HQL94_06150 [Magnetococcales bacterium]|nr:hypothetical protein [Magnetococcales bacterium]
MVGAVTVISIGVAFAGIQGSKHDLGTGGASQLGATGGTAEVCVFCHTPHGSDASASVPLWNKKLPSAASYTRYSSLNTSTLDGAETDVGSVSLACLSCHDGSQAMDSVINAPGSGGYNAAGSNMGAGSKMTGTPIPNLGTDLSNDHPISIQYAGGGLIVTQADGAYNKTTGSFGDPDFNPVHKKTINSQPQWWVESGTPDGIRQKTEMMLYTRGADASRQPYVECGSCHDPHNASTASATQVAFLRTSNAGSAVCLACHSK